MPFKTNAIQTAAAAAALTAGVSAVQLRGHASLDAAFGMRPDVAAKALLRVEDEWVSQVMTFAECNATLPADQMAEEGIDCARSPKEAFEKSCNTIAFTVVKASSGDRRAATEYMSDVCKQAALDGWRRTYCQSLSELVSNTMTADAYENRENYDSRSACTGFWSYLASSEHARAEEEAQKRKMEEEEAQDKAAAAAAAEHQKEQEEAAAQEKAAEKVKESPSPEDEVNTPPAPAAAAASAADTPASDEAAAPAEPAVDLANSSAADAVAPVAEPVAADANATAADATAEALAPAAPVVDLANSSIPDAVATVAEPVAAAANATAEVNATVASTNATAVAPNVNNATVAAINATAM